MPTRTLTLVTLTPACATANYVQNGERFRGSDGDMYDRKIEVQYMHAAKAKLADGYMVTSHEGEVLGYVYLGSDGNGKRSWSFRRVRAAYGHSGRDDGGYSMADRVTCEEEARRNPERPIYFLDSMCRGDGGSRLECLISAGFLPAKPEKSVI